MREKIYNGNSVTFRSSWRGREGVSDHIFRGQLYAGAILIFFSTFSVHATSSPQPFKGSGSHSTTASTELHGIEPARDRLRTLVSDLSLFASGLMTAVNMGGCVVGLSQRPVVEIWEHKADNEACCILYGCPSMGVHLYTADFRLWTWGFSV